ncbi:hypothetical protein M0813_00770 [Anaeramoeba flamelloides]|uniref:Uncharacterized protein n=1 Tax=Anaeramoeba flamelloides TaxID=1746091 RepID=A0ABQ8XP74_9EUKA|nr:hypothetical protein M0813_00770 [Anaeramoeba flamelloides]
MRYENEEVEEIKFTRNWKYVLSHCRCINPKSFMDTIRRNVEIFNLFPQHCKEHYCYTMSKIRKRTKKISTKYPSVKIRRTVSSRNENKVYQLNKLKSPKVDHLPIKSQQNLKENYLSKIHLNQSNSHKILDYKYPEIFNPEKRFIHNFVFFFQNLKNQNYH